MKRTRLKRKSKSDIRKIQDELWELCRALCQRRDENKHGEVFCYTCRAGPLMGSNKQLGHGPWPKSTLGAFLKYDLRVLHWQDARCNLFNGGMGAEYYKRLKEELGDASFAQLEADRRVSVKAEKHYLGLLDLYRQLDESQA